MLVDKIKNVDCVKLFDNSDIVFLSECWLNINTNIDLEGYISIAVPRKRCRGGGLVLFFKEYLNDKI